MTASPHPSPTPSVPPDRVREYEQMLGGLAERPWRVEGDSVVAANHYYVTEVPWHVGDDADGAQHRAFIAASPTIVRALLDGYRALSERVAELERERESLLRFAGHALTDARVEEIGDWDGGELQEALAHSGLIERRERPVPCGEDCRCVEFYSTDEIAECYPITDLGHAAIAAHRAWQDDRSR